MVEDEPLLGSLIEETLAEWGFDVVLSRSARQAVTDTEAFTPDVAILDVNLGSGPSGFDLSISLRSRFPQLPIIFLTNLTDPRVLGRHPRDLPAGSLFVRKSSVTTADDLVATVNALLAGTTSMGLPSTRSVEQLSSLTPAQVAVLQLVVEGASNRRIAEVRGTTERAVEALIQRAAETLGLSADKDVNLRVRVAVEFARAAGAMRDA